MLSINLKIFVVTLFFSQCSQPKMDVEFELLNEELYFSPIFSNEKGGIELLYEDYITKNDKEKSKNILRYKVKNNLPYKIFFIPNSEELAYIWDIKDGFNQYFLSYSIIKEDGQNIDHIFPSFEPKNRKISMENFRRDSIEWAQDTIKYESMYDRMRFKDFTYLAPKETVIFEIGLNLPIVKGSNEPASEVQPLYKEEEYLFQLHYIQNKIEMEKELPKQILDYLKENNIEIIDLSLHSDSIKLKSR